MKEYYRVQANINLDAIRYNLEKSKMLLKEQTKLMAIIKADGYGHGAVMIAKAVDDIVDAYGVAIIEEALQLREAGVEKPILILGHTFPEDNEALIEYHITQTVHQYDMAKELSETCVRMNKTAQIHIKLDTGMSRIGFQPTEESLEIIKKIKELPGLEITGIFTHFACADQKDKTSARKQLEVFLSFVQRLEEEKVNIPIHHVSNSAALIEMSEANLDMVRSGISTYGLYPSEEVGTERIQLHPAMELKSRVVHVKELEPGRVIGYGSTYAVKEKTRIATIPVGYADGYKRALSNKGRVLIHGQSAPIVGRICMDQFMVDVTKIPHVSVGDEVTLIGQDGEERITVEELANMAYSFNYEFVCGISKRVPRVFYLEGKKVATLEYKDQLQK